MKNTKIITSKQFFFVINLLIICSISSCKSEDRLNRHFNQVEEFKAEEEYIKALDLLVKIKASSYDPKITIRVTDCMEQIYELLATKMLDEARIYLGINQKDKALKILHSLILAYPNTTAAFLAKQLVDQLSIESISEK